MRTTLLTTIAAIVAFSGQLRGQEAERVLGFETDADLRSWEINTGTPRLIKGEGVTKGTKALEITFDPGGRYGAAYMSSWRLPADWSGYDALVLDVTNPGDKPIRATLLIADSAWQQKGSSYWNRHNAGTVFAPGRGQWVIPVQGLYRGEAGSRNNDIRRNIDADDVVRVDFGFGAPGSTGRVIVDGLRLVKSGRPATVRAFDFGPPDQAVMPAWTGVSNETAYAADAGYGWGPRGGQPWNGAARDTTFGPLLYRDFCESRGYRFQVDVPRGIYKGIIVFENSGYWGGEQAKHSIRRVLVNDRLVWSEKRPDGAAHPLYRFQDTDPLSGSVWDTYMAPELARHVEFEVTAGGAGLSLRCDADAVWSCKVSALVIYPSGDDEARRWVEDQLAAARKEFEAKAVNLDPVPADAPIPTAWAPRELVAWAVDVEQDVVPQSVPPAGTPGLAELALDGFAVRGESEALCLAVRPAEDGRPAPLGIDPLTGPVGAVLPASVQLVHYNTSRGFNSIAYRIKPHTLRPTTELPLQAGVTRQVVATVRVPVDAAPGSYTGALRIGDLTVPVRLTVSSASTAEDVDFLMGFFGLMPPGFLPEDERWRLLEEALILLREAGMNAVSGGPSWRLSGWRDGVPQLDTAACDRFFALLAEHGFTGPLNGYGGARFQGLHGRYVVGSEGERVAADSGMPYADAFLAAWTALDRHARAAGWPTVYYAMCDETRVREQAERELEFMRLMAGITARFPDTVRASGSYSVHFRNRPTDTADMLHWHQRFFEVLDISSLNSHGDSALAEAARLGKEVHIYNQGRTRYSFGLYQWHEYRRGIKARWQWHLNVLHGYQFFDLDGREPDTAMICYGRDGILPTIHLARCREGAEDFRLYARLEQLLDDADAGPQAAAGRKIMQAIDQGMRLNQRQPPAGYDPRALKRRVAAAIEALQ